MKEPTQEEIKRLWEWCGFVNVNYDETFFKGWQGFWGDELAHIPHLDDVRALGFLFKYAVPKLAWWDMWSFEDTNIKGKRKEKFISASAQLKNGQKPQNIIDKNPVLALFWAIDKVREGGH